MSVKGDLAYLRCPPLRAGHYGPWHTDAPAWRPYVAWVARRHGLRAPGALSVGFPGCHAVFMTDCGYAVKFYAPYWPNDHAAEADVYGALGADRALPVPRVLARGALFPGTDRWPWPYLITTLLPGRSVEALRSTLTPGHLLRLARELAPIVRRLHRLPMPQTGAWRDRVATLRQTAPARRRRDGWPEELVAALPAYLKQAPPYQGPARLVHGDIHDAHVLLQADPAGWAIAGLIDFADAIVGDPAYELVPLHVDLFRCDGGLLKAFLAAYGADPAWGPDWRRRATAYLCLFDNNWLPVLLERLPAVAGARTPEHLEGLLWPGLP